MRPDPLVPPEVDLTGFPYMPLQVDRLQQSKSWLATQRQPELGTYLMNLWCRAWKESPPGSIEADDDVLMDAARIRSMEQWIEVKQELMRGWRLCSDGRYYHPVLCEIVLFAWDKRLEQRARSAVARAKYLEKLRRIKGGNSVTGQSQGQPQACQPSVTESQEGREVKKERLYINGRDPVGVVTNAWAEVTTAADSGSTVAWSDARTAPALEAVGGLAVVTPADQATRRTLQRQFIDAFVRQEH